MVLCKFIYSGECLSMLLFCDVSAGHCDCILNKNWFFKAVVAFIFLLNKMVIGFLDRCQQQYYHNNVSMRVVVPLITDLLMHCTTNTLPTEPLPQTLLFTTFYLFFSFLFCCISYKTSFFSFKNLLALARVIKY